ncbi:gluconate 2-dehydrogenase subunit 3 family protein [Paracoccus liaowanqingii]|uniref:Gluconate 2-dehydrogenase subunit 3 family protein n=1 Tax=Paracoccus liaowanqingii TaxID=2560053 RepID=A0A4Z1BL24_9RHOB|nr:gluconate 2-dehydrogenase subunit 3 family protein [Paracoccus liaowanqingii]TGN61567.1 gluconate 2-dehydrogenase subunit 3 family protein [Paracoccus liaowanqingii]
MNRRQLLTMIAAVTGTAMMGGHRAMAYLPTETGTNIFTPEDAAFLDEVAETLIPATDTPGAKEAGVGAFMTQYVSDCFDAEEQAVFREGMEALQADAQDRFGKPFADLTGDERQQMLQAAHEAAAAQAGLVAEYEERREQSLDVQPSADTAADELPADPDAPQLHWFTPIQQLVLFGFFTSEVGATQVLRYEPVPGEYNGDLDYDGGPAWAT